MADMRVETYRAVDQIREFGCVHYVGGWDEKSSNADKHAEDMIAWDHHKHTKDHLLDGAVGEVVCVGYGPDPVAAMRSALWDAFCKCIRHRAVLRLNHVSWKAVGTYVDHAHDRVAVVVRLG